jgi:hypothetical protein
MRKLFSILFFALIASNIYAQKWPEKGIKLFSKDSLYSMNLRFRMQNRAIYSTIDEKQLSAQEIEARVRRLRLSMEGFIYNPNLTYKIQLSFSRGDMDWNVQELPVVNNSPNVVRDAVLNYKINEHFSVGFGQTKLPGNRQRVISSGQQQFVERSIVNATFNIDRDFGAFLNYKDNIGDFNYIIKTAVSTGEGRNSNISPGGGLAYTGRLELLPLGQFTNGGDYFEGDLERETSPKISFAASYSYNDGALRTAGQLGNDLFESRNIQFIESDFLLKYSGIALSAEFLKRVSDNPVTVDLNNQKRIIYEGEGLNTQLSYIFKNNVELAARYAYVMPSGRVMYNHRKTENYTIGVTKYLAHHKLKIQGNVMYQNMYKYIYMQPTQINSNWHFMFQVELGI